MLLVVKGLRKRFGDQVVLDGFSHCFPSRGLVAIMGKSGSGKSTLLNLLAGLDKPTKGQVLFEGKPLASFKRKEKERFYLSETSYLFQHYNLFPKLNVLRNVALPLVIGKTSRGKAEKKALAMLKEFGLGRLAERSVDSLSGGEKQRVALCRSLIVGPKVLFADEPTGALDEKNAKRVMDRLKSESKKRLVILVSHNKELVDAYADETIVLGEDVPLAKRKDDTPSNKKTVRSCSRWIGYFLRPNLRKNRLKNLAGFLSGFIGFLGLILCLGFFFGYREASMEAQRQTLTYQSASLTKKDIVAIEDSPLKLVKTMRPSIEEADAYLNEIPSATVHNDYSYFFPETMVYRFDGEEGSPCEFFPLYDITLAQGGTAPLTQGKMATENDFVSVIVNEEFAALWNGDVVGGQIAVSHLSTVLEGEATYEITVEARFVIGAVVHEFSFLNAPRVYYSYQGLETYLSKISIGDVSLPAFVDLAPSDSNYGSFRQKVYIHSHEDVPLLFRLMEKGEETDYELSSKAKTIGDSFLSLSSALVSTLYLFLGISSFCLVLILAMTAFANFVSAKKEVALLRLFGAKAQDVRFLFCLDSILVCFFSCLLSLAVSPFIAEAGNGLLGREFGIDRLIRFPYQSFLGLPYLLPILFAVVSIAIGFASSFIPLHVASKVSIVEELRDE